MKIAIDIPDTAVADLKEFYISLHGYEDGGAEPLETFIAKLMFDAIKDKLKSYKVRKDVQAQSELLATQIQQDIENKFTKP